MLPYICFIPKDDVNRDFMLGLGIVLGAPIIDRTGTLQISKYVNIGETETDVR